MKKKTSEKLDSIEKALAKDPRFSKQVLEMKKLRIAAESKNDMKGFFESMVKLLSDALEETKKGTVAQSPNDVMVQNSETAVAMVGVLKDFVEVLKDKEVEKDLSGDINKMIAGFKGLEENMRTIAAKKIPAPIVSVPAPVVNVKAPEVHVPEQKTVVIPETKEAEMQTKLLTAIAEKLIKQMLTVKVSNENPDEAVPVRLVDKGGKKFIDQLVQGIMAASSSTGTSNALIESRLLAVIAAIEGQGTITNYALETGGNLASLLTQLILAVASLSVLDDWDESDRAKVNLIASQAGIDGGSGAVSAKTVRTILATDQQAIPVTPGLTAATPTASNVAYTTSSSAMVNSNANRKKLTVKNVSETERVSLNWDAAAVLDSGITLFAGEGYEFTKGEYDFSTGQLRAIGSAAGSLSVMEWS